jgi:hypothetical protein
MSLGSTYAEDISLDSNYGSGKASNWAGTIYLRLYIGNPTAGGTELTSAGGYAAIAIANTGASVGTNWPNASGGQKINGTVFTFPTSTGAWSANPTYFWLTDSTPNLLDGGPLSGPVIVPGSGYIVSFAAGAIVITAS